MRAMSFTSAVFAAGALLAAAPACGAESEIYLGSGWKYALNGADAVSYQSVKPGAPPTNGSDKYTADYKGAKWRFANVAHRDMFNADPAKYAPQYGGHCSFVIAEGKLAPGDPKVWSIRDGKVYLFANKSVRANWLANPEEIIRKAETHWPAALGN